MHSDLHRQIIYTRRLFIYLQSAINKDYFADKYPATNIYFMKKNILLFPLVFLFLNAISQNGPRLRRIEGQGNDGLVLDFVAGMHDSILNSATNTYNYPLYDNNRSPVYVDIYNPALTPSGEFQIIFNDTSVDFPGNDVTDPDAKWMLVNVALHDTVFGDSVISVNYTQDIPAWGMRIRTNPTDDPGTSVYTSNGFLEATMVYDNPALPWLTGLSDNDMMGPQNWIRSGTYNVVDVDYDNDFVGLDDSAVYEGVLNGTWSPYRLCANNVYSTSGTYIYPGAPAWDKYRTLTQMKNLASVDVVITSDQNKWTRCPVLEEQDDSLLSIGGAEKMSIRKSLSVDKNGRKAGDPGYNAADGDFGGTQPYGMGWFPGYAVNVETGERLNMAFGEDSYLVADNGSDMVWNPTSTVVAPDSSVVYGGKHYIYIFGHNGDGVYPATDPYLPNELRDIPVYDKGVTLYKLLKASESTTGYTSQGYKREVYPDAMWVNIPLLNPGYSLLATDVNIRLRESKQYRQQNIDNTNHTNPKYIFDAGTLAGITMLTPTQNDLQLYPNPANEQLYVRYETTTKNAVVEIYDVTGQLVKQEKMNFSSTQQIDISNLSPGLYVLKITDGKKVNAQRFIKQ